ncbi:MAG: hypothetical protein R6X12_07300 [bacterium]
MTDDARLDRVLPGPPAPDPRKPGAHHRLFGIGGITIRVESDLPFTDRTFDPKFQQFELDGPGPDTVTIRHHFELPAVDPDTLGREVYRKPPWSIYRRDSCWVYLGVLPEELGSGLFKVAVFNDDHSLGDLYHPGDGEFREGGLHSLTMFPTDQILLTPLLADRQACFLHSAGAILNRQGLLFVGHSEAGKSTTLKLIKDRAEILCDDRNIVRRETGEAGSAGCGHSRGTRIRVYGTWSHGELPQVSPASAPLRAILFLEKSGENSLALLDDRSDILGRLLGCVIRSLETQGWWQKTLGVVEALCREVPCYLMRFDKSGQILEQLEALTEVR